MLTAYIRTASDLYSRPTTRNTDTFGYNERGEVVFSRRGAEGAEDAYAYDSIGNQTNFVANAETNTFTHNSLNQLETATVPQLYILHSTFSIFHDLDGNMTNDSVFAYSYDAANRLSTVTSNGIVVVSNQYDYRGRRMRKTTPTTETTFVYDGWNLIHETVSTISGATTNTTEIQYFWGVDLPETLQGAGGVGGLLAVSRNGDFYFPAYDNNGNITKYIDENGNVVAAYEYDAFGKTISQTGSRADFFRHRFSTKYYDAETGLYYYGYRFYAPTLMRWLNRDPIGENGDINQYMFVKNTPLQKVDSKGLDWRIARNGGMFAHAIATKNDDTFEMLAGKLRLDVSDYKIWAHTSDAIPRRCKKYKIPNLVVYDYGGRRFMDRLPTHIISLWRGQNNRQAENDEKKA